MIYHSAYFWFSISLLCLIIEVFTIGFLFGAFSFAAFITALLAFFTHNIYVLLFVFSLISLLTFIFLRPWYLSCVIKKSQTKQFGFHSLLGQVATVTEVITPSKGGYVKVDADRWKAHAEENIEVGSKVKIIKTEGNSVWVEPYSES